MGILQAPTATGTRLLKKLGADPRKLLAELRRSPRPAARSDAAKRVIGWAIEEAQRMRRTRLDTRHLLLGVLWAGDRRLTALLRRHGVHAVQVQKAVGGTAT